MAQDFLPGQRYENATGAFTVLDVREGILRVLTDEGAIGRYTVANQQLHARPTPKPSPFARQLVDPAVRSVFPLVRGILGRRGWEVYAQPHLNGLRPDIVALNAHVGMALFRVSDVDANTHCAQGSTPH